MIFRRELAEKVMAGEKTVTRRLCKDNPRSPWWRERCTYTVGKTFTVNPGRGITNIGCARVLSCRKETLSRVDPDEARREGFANKLDFVAAWEAINGLWDRHEQVWRVEFEVIS